MPKRKADFVSDPSPRLPSDSTDAHRRQAEYIENNSFTSSISCEHCSAAGLDCLMDRSRRYSKCASCTRAGRVCKRDFHTGKEWDLLKRAEDKLSSDIEKNEDELDLLEPELNSLQSRLAELHQQVLNKQKQYQEAMIRQRRLRKQMAFLKQRGFKMSEHDAELLQILDEKQTSPEQTAPSALDLEQLAATAENPNFDQMLAELADLPASYWDGPAFSAGVAGDGSGGLPSPGGHTVEPAGGSPSGSR
jgi:hypothetical protein